MLQDEKRIQVHRFMAKFMKMKMVMRKTQKRERQPRFLLIAVHELSEGKPFMTSQISEKMDVTPAASSQMIDQLVKLGWVKRETDENDRRVIWIDFTQEGKEELRLAFQEASKFIEGMIDYLGEEDAQHVGRIMDKVLEYALKASQEEA